MGNDLVLALREQFQAKYSIDALNMSMSDWICANTTLRGKPFGFKDYEFQRRIIDDMHPNLWVKKISQCGLTESQQRKMLAFLERNQGTTGLFILPNQPMRDRLAKTRVKPLVDNDDVFNKERDKNATRTALLYQLGQSFLHLSDCTEGAATSTPGDILFIDEIDLANQQMVALFGSRLQNSVHKIKQHFSTPTHVSFGVDAGYSASDQHEYFCRCPSCNHWNIPDFNMDFVHIPGLLRDEIDCLSELEQHHLPGLDLDGAYVRCEKCHKALDLTDPSLREWVPRFPSNTFARGYNVLPFVTHRLTIPYIIGELMTYKKNNYIRGWWNTVVGKPYTGGNERLSIEDIEACLDQSMPPDLAPKTKISVGIDSGIMCHVTIFLGADVHTSPVIKAEVIHSEKLVGYITDLAEKYDIVTGGMDRHPQTVLANQVHEASGKKIWPIEYRGTKTLFPIKDPTGEFTTHFQADRTTLLDRVQVRVQKRNLKIAGYLTQKQVIISHLRNMVRDEHPEKPAQWIKLSEDDHYFHSIGMGLTSMVIESFINDSNEEDKRENVEIRGVNTPQVSGILQVKRTLAHGVLG